MNFSGWQSSISPTASQNKQIPLFITEQRDLLFYLTSCASGIFMALMPLQMMSAVTFAPDSVKCVKSVPPVAPPMY